MTFETPPIREYSDLRIGGVFAYLRQLIIMSIIRENDLEEAELLYRFYIGQDQIEEDQIHILDSDVNHIKNVLRLGTGWWHVMERAPIMCAVFSHCPRRRSHFPLKRSRKAERSWIPGLHYFRGFPRRIRWNLSFRRRWNWEHTKSFPL